MKATNARTFLDRHGVAWHSTCTGEWTAGDRTVPNLRALRREDGPSWRSRLWQALAALAIGSCLLLSMLWTGLL